MRKVIVLALWIVIALPVLSQEPVNPMEQITVEDSSAYSVFKNTLPVRKIRTGVDVDMGYMFSSGGYGGPFFSLTPHIIYPLSDKFWINAGVQAGYGQFMTPVQSSEGTDFKMLPMTSLFLYASGNYKVSEKLVVTGTAYRQVINNSRYDQQTAIINYINNGLSVGFKYKLGSNVTIGAQFQVKSSNPDSRYGYYPPGAYYNPYGW